MRRPVPSDFDMTVDVEEFKRDPAATTRRAQASNGRPIAVVKDGRVVLVVSVPVCRSDEWDDESNVV